MWSDVPVLPPLEELSAEINNDPEVAAELRRSLEAGDLPPLLLDNPFDRRRA